MAQASRLIPGPVAILRDYLLDNNSNETPLLGSGVRPAGSATLLLRPWFLGIRTPSALVGYLAGGHRGSAQQGADYGFELVLGNFGDVCHFF
jgi:hypothetical protein